MIKEYFEKGVIKTASYEFTDYEIGTFEWYKQQPGRLITSSL